MTSVVLSLCAMTSVVLSLCLSYFMINCVIARKGDDDEGPVIPPSNCEVCKYLATELKDRLIETGKSKEVLETGHGLDTKKKKVKYNKSELRLIEAMENPHICDRILDYNVHKERKGSLRFAKGMSETFQTLHGLVHKGVKVVMDVPYALWNETSAEVAELQRRCYTVVEEYEDTVANWYYNHQEEDIVDFLCKKHVLKNGDQSCLEEVYVPKGEIEEDKKDEKEDKKEEKKKKKKKSKGNKGEKGAKEEL